MKLVIDIPQGMIDAFSHEEQWTAVLCRDMSTVLQKGTPYEERPKGKWEKIGFADSYMYCKCSECGKTTRLSKNEFCCIADIRNKVIACLYCGADMRDEEE